MAADSTCLRVLVADDQLVVREGLSLLLEAVDGFETAGAVSTCEELLRDLPDQEPDVVLLDFCLGARRAWR